MPYIPPISISKTHVNLRILKYTVHASMVSLTHGYLRIPFHKIQLSLTETPTHLYHIEQIVLHCMASFMNIVLNARSPMLLFLL